MSAEDMGSSRSRIYDLSFDDLEGEVVGNSYRNVFLYRRGGDTGSDLVVGDLLTHMRRSTDVFIGGELAGEWLDELTVVVGAYREKLKRAQSFAATYYFSRAIPTQPVPELALYDQAETADRLLARFEEERAVLELRPEDLDPADFGAAM